MTVADVRADGGEPCLSDVAAPAHVVAPTDTCRDVERLFHRHLELSCVVTVASDRSHLLTRRRMIMEMAGPMGYGRALYAHRPITSIVDHIPTLALPPAMSLDEAGQHALARPNPWRYEDILVDAAGDPRYVAVADLFSHLASVNERRSLNDDLTCLSNRAGFARAVDHALRHAGEGDEGRPAVLFVDLDDFKAVNDSLGHAAGDELLRHLGGRMGEAFRHGDVVARLGGDEFAILLPAATRESAEEVAERVLALIAEPVTIGRQILRMNASVGIALREDPDEPVGVLLRNADLAMYEAKRAGKGRGAAYRDELHARAVTRLELRTELAGVVERGELRAAYQPIVDLHDRSIVALEALLRWDHPRLGTVPPVDFLPLAERSGAIQEIGAWILTEACRRGVEWRRRFDTSLTIAVNVAVPQIESPAFADDVARALEQTGLPASALVLEVTESALMRHDEHFATTLEAIRELGVRIALDDFGVGYSSFGRLDDLPVAELKIDQSFVRRIRPGGRNGVLQGLLGLAHAMALDPVVEGVETEEQAAVLRDLGYRLAQGYLFSRPVPAGEVPTLLSGADQGLREVRGVERPQVLERLADPDQLDGDLQL